MLFSPQAPPPIGSSEDAVVADYRAPLSELVLHPGGVGQGPERRM
jgi:hypothetical protein